MSNPGDLAIDPAVPLFLRLWRRLPIILRALILGMLILTIGQLPPGVFLLTNLKLSPSVPWFLPATLIWLWLFWQYLNGKGRPHATAQQRRADLRGRPLTGRVWIWSMIAGGLGMISVMGLVFVTSRFANLPKEAYEAPFDVSAYPSWTVFCFFLNIAAVAGVVEEAAFRGYMLSQIQRRHGWIIGIAITGLMFFVSHLSHAYASLAFLPFFLMYSLLHGYLVYLTRSILPSIILHTLGDLIVVPMQYGVLAGPGDSTFVTHGLLTLIFGIAAVPAFRRLVTIARDEKLADETAS